VGLELLHKPCYDMRRKSFLVKVGLPLASNPAHFRQPPSQEGSCRW